MMNYMKSIILALWLIPFVNILAAQSPVKCNDPRLHYMGRIQPNADSVALSWPGNAVLLNFTGTGMKAMLRDENGKNYFKVIIDGQLQPDIHPDASKKMYTLAEGLPAGKHQVELFKRTEWTFGKTWVYEFVPDPGTSVDKGASVQKRKIEFYGNSITCGCATLDSGKNDRGTAEYEDNYLSYAAITARHFHAEYSCIARSGIGVLVSWFPQIMPEMYDRLYGGEATPKWDFGRYTPDIVVINLFQNDSWIVNLPDQPEFKHRFDKTAPSAEQITAAYQHFLQNIRQKYPQAHIICTLGSMDATRSGAAWPNYITEAVKNLGDKKTTTLFFPYKKTFGHPRVPEQQVMADQLISYIEKNIKW
jgi:hypothetical protein